MGPTVPRPKILLNTKPRRNVQNGEGEGKWEEGEGEPKRVVIKYSGHGGVGAWTNPIQD